MLLLWPIGGKHGRAIDANAEKGRGETIRAERFSPSLLRTSSPPLFRSPLRSLGSSSGDSCKVVAMVFVASHGKGRRTLTRRVRVGFVEGWRRASQSEECRAWDA
jgi:hypothetical protein